MADTHTCTCTPIAPYRDAWISHQRWWLVSRPFQQNPVTLCRPEFSQFSESIIGFSFASNAKSTAIWVVSGVFHDLATTNFTYLLPNIYVCTYEYLWPINRTRRFAANPTTTVCYLWQLLTCVRLHLQSSTETPRYITNEGGVDTMSVLAISGDVVPSTNFPLLEIIYRLQFDKQRKGAGLLSNGSSILRIC